MFADHYEYHYDHQHDEHNQYHHDHQHHEYDQYYQYNEYQQHDEYNEQHDQYDYQHDYYDFDHYNVYHYDPGAGSPQSGHYRPDRLDCTAAGSLVPHSQRGGGKGTKDPFL